MVRLNTPTYLCSLFFETELYQIVLNDFVMIHSINPYKGQTIASFETDSASVVDGKILKANKAFRDWKKHSFAQKADLMKKAGAILRKRQDEFAKTISAEMGKIVAESKSEIEKCANGCDYFAENAEQFLKDVTIPTEASKSLIAFQPLGPVLAIMPWNFPLWQVFRFAAPALMAGNVGLLKHAGNVTQCSLLIENVFREAGFPEGVFQSLIIESKEVARIISRDEIAAVTLTGSEYAGTQVAATAGQHLKKTVLELGGSDPFIVLEDADLDLAAKIGTQSRMQNAGQSCIAAKRFIVVQKIKDQFIERFKNNIEALRQGDQFDPQSTTGPIARLDLAEQLEKQLTDSIRAGAQLISGGTRSGCNFKPTLLTDVKPGMVAFDEEMFGPIASLVTVNNEEEAIEMANRSRYGLGSSVWTTDRERGERVARQIESGSVFVNSLMRSDQRLPFGGVKKSGYGRELSELGIKEFVNAKTIYIG
jgi:succinate-semialdehyde dehydrogenase / glutarate-semialdehyde dehydrogenase